MLAAFLRKKFKPSQTQIFYTYSVIANRADQAINRHAQCQWKNDHIKHIAWEVGHVNKSYLTRGDQHQQGFDADAEEKFEIGHSKFLL